MAERLSDAKIKALRAPDAGQLEFADSVVPGLRVRIGKSGVRTFILRKRVAGKVRNVTLGRHGPRFLIDDARRKARALLSDIEAGLGVPKPEAKGEIAGQTIRAMLPRYLAAKRKKGLRARSLDDVKRLLEGNVLPELGDRLADTVTRRDVSILIDRIAERSVSRARATHAQLRAFYNWALPELDRLPANPCIAARCPPAPAARERVLDDRELAALWQIAQAEPAPWGPALALLILTGARRSEVFGAEWAEFDLACKLWTIPAARSKNGEAHTVPLSEAALAVLGRILPDEASGKAFAARGKPDRGASGFSKMQARFRAELDRALEREEGPHWQLHDIRRTVATGLQRLGVAWEVNEAVLNHLSGARSGVAGIYQRHRWETEKRDALDRWASHVLGLAAQGAQQSE